MPKIEWNPMFSLTENEGAIMQTLFEKLEEVCQVVGASPVVMLKTSRADYDALRSKFF